MIALARHLLLPSAQRCTFVVNLAQFTMQAVEETRNILCL